VTKKTGIAAVAALALLLAGCAGDGSDQGKEIGGTVIGAIAGGLLGAQIGDGAGQLAATAAGTLLGAYLGGEVGRSLDKADRQAAQQTTAQALEYNTSGTSSSWSNPDSGNYGYVTPQQAYYDEGKPCRPYTQTIYIDGRAETAEGTACRGADGVWRIQ